MKTVLVTGSSGLVGSECVSYFDAKGWRVVGIDNNQRRQFFGADGDTAWNLQNLLKTTRHFTIRNQDIRDRDALFTTFAETRPDYIVHSAAQPSHDLAARIPLEDFDINARGTVNLLEAARQYAPEAPFCFMSSNKVYGDHPNRIPIKELDTRWVFDDPAWIEGIDETMPIDQCTHSIFGAGKTAADIMVQEYGRYYGLPTCCLRGGCLTGPRHSPAELHGFLAWLAKCVREKHPFNIFGYKGKQVRDNIHSFDVCRAIECFFDAPRAGEVYNLGGGRANSISIMEALNAFENITGEKIETHYHEEPRRGDHICYISNTAKFQRHFPDWSITRPLESILKELLEENRP